jgi:hypothetical protein
MLDDCGVCGGDGSSCADCCGVPNGDGTTCDGLCGACNDDTSCLDCAGVANGDSTIDECGTCDNDTTNDCVEDCNGDWGGTAVLDDCGVCGGDNSSCTGCMDEDACNFNPDAEISDESACYYLDILTAEIEWTSSDGANGVGTVTTLGGEGELSFSWIDSDNVVVSETDTLYLNWNSDSSESYTVIVTDASGCVASLEVSQTGVNDLNSLVFGLFPNPTTGAITLQVSTEVEDLDMQVFDATGRVVFAQDNLIVQGSISLDFSYLSTGTYTIMLRNDNGVSVSRLSVQH